MNSTQINHGSCRKVCLSAVLVLAAAAVLLLCPAYSDAAPAPAADTDMHEEYFLHDGKGTLQGLNTYYYEEIYDLTEIYVPDTLGGVPVTSIGVGALGNKFTGYTLYKATSIRIPDTVTYIGDSAFYMSSAIDTIRVGDDTGGTADLSAVTYVGDGAFYDCGISGKVILSGSEHIGKKAFYDCGKMTEVVLSKNLEYVGDSAFEYLLGLSVLVDGADPGDMSSIGYIGDYAFSFLKFNQVLNLTGAKHIGDGAFLNADLFQNLMLGHDVELGNRAFAYCYWIKTVTVGSIASCGSDVFMECEALEVVSLSGMPCVFGDGMFRDCAVLESVTSDGTEGAKIGFVTSVGQEAFLGTALGGELDLSSATHVGAGAFKNLFFSEITFGPDARDLDETCFDLDDFQFADFVDFDGYRVDGEYVSGKHFAGDFHMYSDGNQHASFFTYEYGKITGLSLDITLFNLPNPLYLPSYYMKEPVVGVADGAFKNVLSSSKTDLWCHVVMPETEWGYNIGEEAFYGCDVVLSIGTEPLPKGTFRFPAIDDLGDRAFYGCTAMTDLDLSGVGNRIGTECFVGCDNLRNLKLPEKLWYMGASVFEGLPIENGIELPYADDVSGRKQIFYENTFRGCTKIPYVRCSEFIPGISDGMFEGCTSLETVFLRGVDRVGVGAFRDCTALKEVHSGQHLLLADKECFRGCTSLVYVDIIQGPRTIGEGAFRDCTALKEADFEVGVYVVEARAFMNCRSLEKINWGIDDPVTGVTSIGEEAFMNCGRLKTLDFPDNLTDLGARAFHSCIGLTDVNFNRLQNIGSDAFRECRNLGGTLGLGTVRIIGENAFNSCGHVDRIIFSDHLQSVSGNSFALLGTTDTLTFDGFEVDAMDGGKLYVAGGDFSRFREFTGEFRSQSNWYSGSFLMEGSAIVGLNPQEPLMDGLMVLSIPDHVRGVSVESIAPGAFWPSNTSPGIHRLPGSVTAVSFPLVNGGILVGDSAFRDCTGLTSVTAVGSERSMDLSGIVFGGEHVFEGCTSLAGSLSAGQLPGWTFAGCTSLETVELHGEAGESAFEGCTGLKSADIGADTGESAFEGCTGLKSVVFLKGADTIGTRAFAGCTGLVRVDISEKLMTVEESAFEGCSGLTTVNLGTELRTIGAYAFRGCPVQTVDARNNRFITSFSQNAFLAPGKSSPAVFDGRVLNENDYDNAFWIRAKLFEATGPGSMDYTVYSSGAVSVTVDSDGSVCRYPTEAFRTETLSGPTEFRYDTGTKAVTDGLQPWILRIGDSVFESGRDSLWYADGALLESVTVTSGMVFTSSEVTPPETFIWQKRDGGAYLEAYNGTDSTVRVPSVCELDGRELQVVGICAGAFAGNMSLQGIAVPASVRILESPSDGEFGVFEGCAVLRAVVFAEGSSLEQVGARAFSGCISLAGVDFRGMTLRGLDMDAFTTDGVRGSFDGVPLMSEPSMNAKLVSGCLFKTADAGFPAFTSGKDAVMIGVVSGRVVCDDGSVMGPGDSVLFRSSAGDAYTDGSRKVLTVGDRTYTIEGGEVWFGKDSDKPFVSGSTKGGASFLASLCQLRLTAGEGGTVDEGGWFPYGTEVVMDAADPVIRVGDAIYRAVPDEGSSFLGWSDEVSVMDGHISLQAGFELVKYEVTLYCGTGGTVEFGGTVIVGSEGSCTFEFPYGTEYSVSGNVLTIGGREYRAVALPGYGDPAWENRGNGVLEGDEKFIAEFSTSVTVGSGSYGHVDGAGRYRVEVGTEIAFEGDRVVFVSMDGRVSAQAVPMKGYEFDCWRIESGSQEVTGPTSVTAYFKADSDPSPIPPVDPDTLIPGIYDNGDGTITVIKLLDDGTFLRVTFAKDLTWILAEHIDADGWFLGSLERTTVKSGTGDIRTAHVTQVTTYRSGETETKGIDAILDGSASEASVLIPAKFTGGRYVAVSDDARFAASVLSLEFKNYGQRFLQVAVNQAAYPGASVTVPWECISPLEGKDAGLRISLLDASLAIGPDDVAEITDDLRAVIRSLPVSELNPAQAAASGGYPVYSLELSEAAEMTATLPSSAGYTVYRMSGDGTMNEIEILSSTDGSVRFVTGITGLYVPMPEPVPEVIPDESDDSWIAILLVSSAIVVIAVAAFVVTRRK